MACGHRCPSPEPSTLLPPLLEQDLEEGGYRRIKDEEAEALWRFWFDWSAARCVHGAHWGLVGVGLGLGVVGQVAADRCLGQLGSGSPQQGLALAHRSTADRASILPCCPRRPLRGAAPRRQLHVGHPQGPDPPDHGGGAAHLVSRALVRWRRLVAGRRAVQQSSHAVSGVDTSPHTLFLDCR